MFDRRSHLLETIRTLAAFTGGPGPGDDPLDDRHFVVKSFAHSYAVYRRLFGDFMSSDDREFLDSLFDRVKDIEAPVTEMRRFPWLSLDVRKSKFWKELREMAGQAAARVAEFPDPEPEPLVEFLPLEIVHYRAERFDNPAPPEDLEQDEDGVCPNDLHWHQLRQELLHATEKYGLTGPDDPARESHFYLVDDRYNEERYHYLEVYHPPALTLNWLADVTGVLGEYPGWGVGVKNLRDGYLLIFSDRLLVTGAPFRRCRDAPSVLQVVRTLI